MMGLDPNLFTIKVESMILAKGLSFLFQRIGCLFLAEITTVVFLDEVTLANMMVNSGGADSSASEGTSGTKPPVPATPASSENSSLGAAPPQAAPALSAERTEELLQENLRERKGDLGEGQSMCSVREGVEQDFNVSTTGQKFDLVKQLEVEKEVVQGKPAPATNSAFNEIRDHEGQDSSVEGILDAL